MAEKKAALEVVYNRLADAGLENYCLEVHSTATSRQAFYERLKQRVQQDPPPDVSQALEQQVEECSQLRQQLSRYVRLLNQPIGRSGKTIQTVLWATQRANDAITGFSVPSTLPHLQDEQAITLTENDVQRKCQHLQEFSQQHQSLIQTYSQVEHHPWFGLTAHALSPIDQGDLCANATAWASVLHQLQTRHQHVAETLGVEAPTTLATVQTLRQQLESCPQPAPLLEPALLPALRTAQVQNSVTSFVRQLKDYRQAERSLEQFFEHGTVINADFSPLQPLLARLQTIVTSSQGYTIVQLENLGRQAAETHTKLRQYRPLVNQISGFLQLGSSLAPNDIAAIETVIQILHEQSPGTLEKRTAELCEPSNRSTLLAAKETCQRLRSQRSSLEQTYNLAACQEPSQMRRYARTLRSANLFTYWFDSDYKNARATWKSIRRDQAKLADAEVATKLDELASFFEEVNSFKIDTRLRQICGSYFQALETDFDALLAANHFGATAHSRLSAYRSGHDLCTFLVQATTQRLNQVSSLRENRQFQALLNFVIALKATENFDAHQNWEELTSHYQAISSVATQVYASLNSFGLRASLSVAAVPGLMQRLEALEATRQRIAVSEAINTLGYFYREGQTDVEQLEATLNFAQAVTQAQLPQAIQNQLLTTDAVRVAETIRNAVQNLANLLEQEAQYRQAFFRQGQPDTQAMFGSQDMTRLDLESIARRLDRAVAASEMLAAWVNYHRAYQQVVDDRLQSLVAAFERENVPLDNLEAVYQAVFYRSLLRVAYQQHPELNQFSGINQAQARQQFQQADSQLLRLYQQHLVAQLAQVPIELGNGRGRRSTWTNLALIRHQITLQQRHIPLRNLFQRAGVALQQLKPCWMMSPASVAQFIPPSSITFDLVIIDEASQMRPEEALGSLARANQLIVVGDPKQLPPTDFFRANVDYDSEEGNDGEAEGLDDESILDMALKVFYPARRLKWHYRSRHESLIAFSNQRFYNNSLTIFPSPNNQFAVEYRYIETGAYRSGTNIPEVTIVAAAAAEFMRQYPELSLGIVTLNQKQQQLLLDEMDRLFALQPEIEQYRADRENTLEPFFVKNLENVQGDERDVIFISTVYGPESPGMPVMQRFGPINSRSGHRRLNVLFTRAKERIVVFSSMQPSDIRPSPTSNTGVQILKEYLNYAQTQQLQTAVVTGREPDSDFEVFVAERLRQQGYEVVPQVGVSGYFIDLAVIDPQRSGTYLLGIECDGATYHSSKAARDRDRLRQQVLERLGWKLYRIWSTDWFTNPGVETAKLLRHISQLSGVENP